MGLRAAALHDREPPWPFGPPIAMKVAIAPIRAATVRSREEIEILKAVD